MIRRLVTVVVTLGLILPAIAWAEDFRVQSKVTLGNQKKPYSENTTLFRGGVVYDYLTEPPFITVFDPAHGRFLLLDPRKEQQAEVKTTDIDQFNERLRQECLTHEEPLMQFLAKPMFSPIHDEETGAWVLGSEFLTYRIWTLEAKNDAAARQYSEFSNWYAKLNTMINVGAPPPFARLEVNAFLEPKGLIPEKVTLVRRMGTGLGGGREVTVRSEHEVIWRLLEADMRQIVETGKFINRFEQVTLEKLYQGPTEESE